MRYEDGRIKNEKEEYDLTCACCQVECFEHPFRVEEERGEVEARLIMTHLQQCTH